MLNWNTWDGFLTAIDHHLGSQNSQNPTNKRVDPPVSLPLAQPLPVSTFQNEQRIMFPNRAKFISPCYGVFSACWTLSRGHLKGVKSGGGRGWHLSSIMGTPFTSPWAAFPREKMGGRRVRCFKKLISSFFAGLFFFVCACWKKKEHLGYLLFLGSNREWMFY